MAIPYPRLLLGPGPSEPHPLVLAAMSRPVLGHLDPDFLQCLTDVQTLLRSVLKTKNECTFAVSGTGMAGMECVVANLIEPGEKMVVCSAGFFGDRMVNIAQRAGAAVHAVKQEWGKTFTHDAIEEALKEYRPKVLGIIQAETTTGAWQKLEGVAELCHRHGALLVVDAVTSLGTVEVAVDAWQIDALYSGSQKGLGCPPGLAPVTFSPRAMEAIKQRKTPVTSFYLDVVELMKYWGNERGYHHTAPIGNLFALREGLQQVIQEGLAARWDRHARHAASLRAGLAAMGLKLFTDPACQLPAITVLLLPDGLDDVTLRRKLLSNYGIEVGGGLGTIKGKAWRIGLMGYGSSKANVLTLLAALEEMFREAGVNVPLGAGVAAAVSS
ncbi:MAG: alanine--glyoxylate aminotransferase family protein [Gemmatales bacterium]